MENEATELLKNIKNIVITTKNKMNSYIKIKEAYKKYAIHLIEDTFNAKFDKNQFTLFIKNFLNDIEPKRNNYSV